VASLAPIAALLAAILVAWVGWNNLKHQQTALRVSVQSDARNLRQKRQADGRSEWWRRTQWALEASERRTSSPSWAPRRWKFSEIGS
jgi:hypothetical protein